MLKSPNMPSVLVEIGYISNSEDEAYLRSAEGRDAIVSAVAAAIADFAAKRRGQQP